VFLRGAVTGDLGRSFVHPGAQLILEKMPATLELASTAMLIAIVLGSRWLWAGLRPHVLGPRDRPGDPLPSLPTFWVGGARSGDLVMLGWLPKRPGHDRGRVRRSAVVPDGRQAASRHAGDQTRAVQPRPVDRAHASSAHEALLQDYVKFARAKGLSNRASACAHLASRS
jgi:peptide/nickel transport system permease protein